MNTLPLDALYYITELLDYGSYSLLCNASKSYRGLKVRALWKKPLYRYLDSISSFGPVLISRDVCRPVFYNRFLALLIYAQDEPAVEAIEYVLQKHPEWIDSFPNSTGTTMSSTLYEARSNLAFLTLLRLGKKVDMNIARILVSTERFLILLRLGRVSTKALERLIDLGQWFSYPLADIILTGCNLSPSMIVSLIALYIKHGGYSLIRELFLKHVCHSGDSNSNSCDNGCYYCDITQVLLSYILDNPHPYLVKLFISYASDEAVSLLPVPSLNRTSTESLLRYSYPRLRQLHLAGSIAQWDDLDFWRRKWETDLSIRPLDLSLEQLRQEYRDEVSKPVYTIRNEEGDEWTCALSLEEGRGFMTALELLSLERFDIKDISLSGTKVGNAPLSLMGEDEGLYSMTSTKLASRVRCNNYPALKYTCWIGKRRVQCHSLEFVGGARAACELLGIDCKEEEVECYCL